MSGAVRGHPAAEGRLWKTAGEWRLCMQDEPATGQLDPVSRVKKLTDTDGDGKRGRRTVFIDKVILPRTLLPLHDRVLVNFTEDQTIWASFCSAGLMPPLDKTHTVKVNGEHTRPACHLWRPCQRFYRSAPPVIFKFPAGLGTHRARLLPIPPGNGGRPAVKAGPWGAVWISNSGRCGWQGRRR